MRLIAAALLAMVCGCAPTPQSFTLHPTIDPGRERLWPAAPEIPRYRYAGQLIGEQNYAIETARPVSSGQKLLRWIVGLGRSTRDRPTVLVRPQSGMVDDRGHIYVTDAGRAAVFVFRHEDGLQVWEMAQPKMRFRSPVGIAAGERPGEVLVADADLGRVFRLDANGSALGSFGEGTIVRPTGIARDPIRGEVYVADSAAHDIKVFDDAGRLKRLLGSRGRDAGQFNAPTHLAFRNDRLYVSDTLNARVQVLAADGQPLSAIGQRGLYIGNLTRPKGVAVDARDNVYVVESYYDHVLVFGGSGQFLLPIGGSGRGIGQFFLPSGAWSDDHGRIFVADMYNGRVMIFEYLGA